MVQLEMKDRRRKRLLLSLRVSLLLVLAAVIPLFIVVAASELLTRPALIAQGDLSMESDASIRVQLIDTT